jgi:hypothetical protein
MAIPKAYLEAIIDDDMDRLDGIKRNKSKMTL